MQNSNFSFLTEKWEILANLGKTAERNVYIDPNTTLIKLRLFAEILTKYILAYEEIKEAPDTRQIDRINALRREGLITPDLENIFETIRRLGNKAAHDGYGTQKEAVALLRMAFRLAVWFMQVYGDWKFEEPAYREPVPVQAIDQEELQQLTAAYEAKVARLEDELKRLRKEQISLSEQKKQQRKQDAKTYGDQLDLTEEETRLLIDQQLRAVGWEADSEKLRYSQGTRPEKGRNLAIAEWPIGDGKRADYALFVGLEFLGMIEAKRLSKSILSDIEQAKQYARLVEKRGQEVILGPYGDYFVPFLFATNGKPYLKQFEERSGIWFLDARKPTNHPRPLRAWYSPAGLKELLKQDIEGAHQKLRDEKLGYLRLRPYQEKAIHAVENAIENGQDAILVAMATGTGKTRMSIGLIYRLIKHKRFKRILFLVDRTALAEQAEAAFKDSKLENYRSFTEIFELQSLDEVTPNPETKVHIATVQGMLKRVIYAGSEAKPPVDQYDCIVVDEAHRGYTLDKEMSEVEALFRDHQDYVSKYRQVIDYFDAVKIGLTATPALHTVEIFGRPVFTYSYREAVVDGYLIDHEPPYQFETVLKQSGIRWEVGEAVEVYDTRAGEIETEILEDEVKIDVSGFNKKVITESFNRVVLAELAKHIDPIGPGKTLIFAATDDHADMVVRILKEELEKIHGPIEDNTVMKITGSIKDPSHAIRLFKNERLPNIAVTVDLLTTGIDVPEIVNLVFLRRVRSRILYEQMLGRATRRCDEIDKDHFSIFDAVGIYESLQLYTSMKPVVTRPKVTVEQLVNELEQINDPALRQQHKEELMAKVQRIKQRWGAKEKEDFKFLTGGQSIEEFVNWMKTTKADVVAEKFTRNENIIRYLDENRERSDIQYISHHQDQLIEVTRGYGKAERPEDYLESFGRFVRENMNLIPALQIVCTRPSDLTRQQLRELKLTLEQKGFTEKNLQAAWRDAKNEEIAADIISFIRQQALGDPLISHEERIKRAMKKIYSMKAWPKVQKAWLQRIERQLLKETILGPDPEQVFNVEPFKSYGGYQRLNRIFDGQLNDLIRKINHALFDEKEHA